MSFPRIPTKPFLVIVAPESGDLTPDDLVIVEADTEQDVRHLWDEHDGRNYGSMIFAVYRQDPVTLNYVRDESFGILGNPGRTGPADADEDVINRGD